MMRRIFLAAVLLLLSNQLLVAQDLIGPLDPWGGFEKGALVEFEITTSTKGSDPVTTSEERRTEPPRLVQPLGAMTFLLWA